MAENIISNPFVGCTARDMKYDEVKQYWCSPFELYDLSEGELLTCRTPIVLEGVRGTGKTMILKYLSYTMQKDFIEEKTFDEKLNYFEKRSIGIYFRYKFDFCSLFGELDCNEQDKKKIFKHYYELFIIRNILEVLEDIYYNQDKSEVEKLLCAFLHISNRNMQMIHLYVNDLLKQMDRILNTVSYDKFWRDKMMPFVGSGNMLIELIQTINNSLPGWENILFVILLDEYENLGEFQKEVNTLIKQVDDTTNLTYRLGMRPAGMDDNNGTNVGSEKLQVDRDFLLRPLKYKKFRDYKNFALEISKRRLLSIDAYRENNLVDIYAILGKNEDFDTEANSIAKGIKHFKILQKLFSEEEMKNVIEELSCDEKLMEMYNIIRVLRGEDYKKTGKLSRQYQLLRRERKLNTAEEELHKYRLDYSDKYRVSLLYILLTIYSENKLYYSVNTFLRLSSGSINDFISLCRNVFKHMNNEMLDELIKGNIVNKKIQTYAAIDTAEDQRRKIAQSNKFGSEMYSFIDNMGSIFEEYHRDIEAKYPETNQFAFINENQIRNDEELKKYLFELTNSGAIIKKSKRQLISVGKRKGNIYQLNRIYAPIYQFSYRTRGGYNQLIRCEDFKIMLKDSIDPKDFVGNKTDNEQIDMFAYIGEENDESTDL